MKKAYIAPDLEVEFFELNSSIASNCEKTVDFGPVEEYNPGGSICNSFGDVFGSNARAASNGGVSFYENICSCYYSSGGEGWVSS